MAGRVGIGRLCPDSTRVGLRTPGLLLIMGDNLRLRYEFHPHGRFIEKPRQSHGTSVEVITAPLESQPEPL